MSTTVRAVLDQAVVAMDNPTLQKRADFERDVGNIERFVFHLARTLDEHDARGRPKPFPKWPYLKELLRLYDRCKRRGDNLLVEKCRQVMVTWLFAAVLAYELRQPNRRWGWVSLKESHADAALERVWYVITHLPGRETKPGNGRRGYRDAGGVDWERAAGSVWVPALHSVATAMPQTADDARSYTYSSIVFDEWAHQPLAREGYAAAKPTVDKGMAIGITTPGPLGFVCDLYAGSDFAELAS